MARKTRRGMAVFLIVIGLGALVGSLNGAWLGYPWAYIADGVIGLVGLVSFRWESR